MGCPPFRDDTHAIRLGVRLNTAGGFYLGVTTDCLRPDGSTATKGTSQAAAPARPNDEQPTAGITDVLG